MLYLKKICLKKLLQSKDLNVLRLAKNWKSKLVSQKNSIKILSLIKKKKKSKEDVLSQIYFMIITFFKYRDTKEFAKRPLDSKLNESNEFKDKLESFYYDTEEIKPVNENQKKYLEDRKSKINTASKLCDKLLNIYTAQYNKPTEDQKKMINFLKRPENLTLGFTEDDLPPMKVMKSQKKLLLKE